MKYFVSVIAVAFIILLFPLNAAAAEQTDSDIYSEQYFASGADELEKSLPDNIKESTDMLGIDLSDPESLLHLDFSSAIDLLFKKIRDGMTLPLRSIVGIAAVILLWAVMSAVEPGSGWQKDVFSFLACAATGIILFTPISQTVNAAKEGMASCSVFMSAFVPVYAAMLMSGGYTATAGGFTTVVFAFTNVFGYIASFLLVPLCTAMFAIALSSSLGKSGISGVAAAINKTLSIILGFLMTLFLGVLGLQTSVSAASDNLAFKTARFFAGSFVPIVGPTIGESVTTVFSCLMLLKTSLGVLAIVCLALIMLPVLARLLTWRLILAVSAALLEITENPDVSKAVRAIGSVITMLIVLSLCCGVMYIVSCAMTLSLGGG